MVNSREDIFLGHFEHGLDEKGRLFIPARFRHKNGRGTFILTRGLEQCLYLFPEKAWAGLAQKLAQLPLADKKEERAFKRLLLAGATEAGVDSQGRVLIPQSLLGWAGLAREAVIIGVLSHVEIWASDKWAAYESGAQESFHRAAAHLEL